MFSSALASGLHIFAIVLALGSYFMRGHFLRKDLENEENIKKVLWFDNICGLAAMLLIGSGLWRLLGGLEKGTEFYTQNSVFWFKMGLLGLASFFECFPMLTFIRWRVVRLHGEKPDTSTVPALIKLDQAEIFCFVLIIFAAPFMARGFGQWGTGTSQVPEEYQAGLKIFQSQCISCHQFGSEGIGPALAGVTERRERAWIFRFVSNPDELLASDPQAQELLEQYNGVPMPDLGLNEKEVEAVVSYLEYMDNR